MYAYVYIYIYTHLARSEIDLNMIKSGITEQAIGPCSTQDM